MISKKYLILTTLTLAGVLVFSSLFLLNSKNLDKPLKNNPCNVKLVAQDVSIKRKMALPNKIISYPNEHDLAITAKTAYLSILKHVNDTHVAGDKLQDFTNDRCDFFAFHFSKYSEITSPPTFSIPKASSLPHADLYVEILSRDNIYCLGPNIEISPKMDFGKLDKNLLLYRAGCRSILPQIKYQDVDLPENNNPINRG